MNYLLIIFAAIMLLCVIRGSKKGLILIIYGMISWIFIIAVLGFVTPVINDYLQENTEIAATIDERIKDRLNSAYELEKENNEPEGLDKVISLLPDSVAKEIEAYEDGVREGIVGVLSGSLTQMTMRGIGSLLGMLLSIVLVFLIGRLIGAISKAPVLNGVNRLSGMAVGFVEGLLIIWITMYLAICFSTTTFGQFVIKNSTSSVVLNFLFENNLIEQILK
ncbi:MAG: CvpA family protein [Pseudobutyrivibrio sp.]|nr:CvpA family protein [Pseudobutyrivibrio sp.]